MIVPEKRVILKSIEQETIKKRPFGKKKLMILIALKRTKSLKYRKLYNIIIIKTGIDAQFNQSVVNN